MADLSELLNSKKVSEFVRQGKSRPWTVDNAPSEVKNKPGETRSISSSFLDLENFKTTTTTTSEPELLNDTAIRLSPEWLGLDYSALAQIGFTEIHLVQLAKQGKISTAEVESSIEFFAFDLRRNGKAKSLHGSPLNFFMGILRKGIPYAPPENYESAADEPRRRTREILERKSVERQAEGRLLMDLEFAEWRRGLTGTQAIALVPDAVKDLPQAREASLRNHFDEQVYPALQSACSEALEIERAQIRAEIVQSLGDVES